jgi:hypothetical protein
MQEIMTRSGRVEGLRARQSALGPVVRPEHVAAQAAAVLQKSQATVVGIQVAGTWAGGDFVRSGDEQWPVVYCPSVLAVREALTRHARESSSALIILTPVPDDQLGWDVRVRLAKGRLIAMDPWSILLDLFRARSVDPRIARLGWMADTLLETMPAGGYPPAPSGLVDADLAWAHVLRTLLGLPGGRPDVEALLSWSADPAAGARFAQLTDEQRTGICRRFEESAGQLGRAIVGALQAGHAHLLVPIGLACEVLFPATGDASRDLENAAVRLEAYLNGSAIDVTIGRRWAAAARQVLERVPPSQAVQSLQQAESLLADVRADAFVGLSTALPRAYSQRLASFGGVIQEVISGEATVADAKAAHDGVAEHRHAVREPERLERLSMAMRLLRFIDGQRTPPVASPASMAQFARIYADEWSYVDWARTLLLAGESEPELSDALALLLARVREIRESGNRRFADVLAAWSRLPNAEQGIVPVERVLEHVVGPIAAKEPALVLVVDGLDYVVYRQLLQDLRDRGWEQWVSGDGDVAETAIAVLPSVTAYSRTSLLTGGTASGTGPDEKRGFATHPALLSASKPKRAPRLFHKGDLTSDGSPGLSAAVRDAIRDAEQRVVGVVLNAVDDFLAKSDQIRPRWSVDQIALLYPILYEASLARRVVILASDHGHVLEAGTSAIPGGEEERWRPFAEPVADAEIVIEGPRVMAVTGMSRVITPWSEAVRYTRKKAGYHGGATPQEVVIPLAVLAPWDHDMSGWQALPEKLPTWWDDAAPEPAVVAPAALPLPRPRKRAPLAQPSLFGDASASTASAPSWISVLLESPLYRAQQDRAGRISPPDATIRTLLEALEQHRGRAQRAILARARRPAGDPDARHPFRRCSVC